MTPDVNILLAAARSDHQHHTVARGWLETAVADAAGGGPLRLQPMVIASFLRLVTHRRVFVIPTPTQAALHFVDTLLHAPGVVQATLGSEWPTLQELCREHALTANDIPDAWLAAAVIHQRECLASFDAGFHRLLQPSQFMHLKP